MVKGPAPGDRADDRVRRVHVVSFALVLIGPTHAEKIAVWMHMLVTGLVVGEAALLADAKLRVRSTGSKHRRRVITLGTLAGASRR